MKEMFILSSDKPLRAFTAGQGRFSVLKAEKQNVPADTYMRRMRHAGSRDETYCIVQLVWAQARGDG